MRLRTWSPALLGLLALAACTDSDPVGPEIITPVVAATPVTMTVLGRGDFKPVRTTGELFVRGTTAYTTTWGNALAIGSAFYIWDVAANVPRLIDSVVVPDARTIGDVAVSDDGSLLVVATEFAPGSIIVYSLANPRQPVQIARFTNAMTNNGVHSAEIGRVNGRLHAFLSVNSGGGQPSRLVIVDLGTPSSPQQVYAQAVGNPFIHDTFVRDGFLFLGLWNDGVAIWDIGGGGRGGSVSAPVELSRLRTAGGQAHNIWWLKDPVTGSARYAFVGQEGPGSGGSSSGDVHVVDVSNMSAPREVAFYTVPGAGTHNFSVDEPNGILYAAFYNGGVRALDVRGDLGTCTDAQKSTPAGSTVPLCDLRKMGRERGIGLLDIGNPVRIWGVQHLNGSVYASDMLNGIWKLGQVNRP